MKYLPESIIKLLNNIKKTEFYLLFIKEFYSIIIKLYQVIWKIIIYNIKSIIDLELKFLTFIKSTFFLKKETSSLDFDHNQNVKL